MEDTLDLLDGVLSLDGGLSLDILMEKERRI